MGKRRGLVVSPPVTISGQTLRLEATDIDPQELRTSLLFWDVLDYPANNIVSMGSSPDVEFLQTAGALQRTRISIDLAGINSNFGQSAAKAHMAAFRELDAQEPGQWSLATGERSFRLLDDQVEEGRGLLFGLYAALPVPDKSVALADLLEFRVKREAELMALRHHIEDVYQKIIAASDSGLSLVTETERLQRSIQDHIKIMKESRFPLRLTDLKANLNLAPGAAAGLSAIAFGLPLVPSLITGAVASVSLEVGAALKGKRANATPYSYITSYHRELFTGP